ncbi:predicted protein [Chaetoceros tenuissimus]|uniref:MYND-type domain-containing protein n=1 Tax=Chaetoceros tenuissimus TaxID=426638 RepID=A0AAD3CMM4_9STRA|nr:predicted protein [Chaetoceros tenuissimus]
MQSSILEIKCSRCGKVEKPNEEKFQACSKCIEIKMLPDMYCSDECFRLDWKTHKKKHREFSAEKAEHLEASKEEVRFMSSSNRFIKRMKNENKHTQFTYMMYAMETARTKMDYDRAESLCRKMISLYPFVPEPYKELAIMKLRTDKSSRLSRRDAARLLEVSMEKTAQLLLNGDTSIRHSSELKSLKEKSMSNLSFPVQCRELDEKLNMMFEMIQDDLDNVEEVDSSIFEANWVVSDRKFMAMWLYLSQIMMDKDLHRSIQMFMAPTSESFPYEILLEHPVPDPDIHFSEFSLHVQQQVDVYNTLVRSGIIYNGLFHEGLPVLDPNNMGLVLNNRTPEELMIAKEIYMHAFLHGSEIVEFYNSIGISHTSDELFVVHPNELLEDYLNPIASLLEAGVNEFDPKLSSSPFFDGEWVIAHGLTSDIGKRLNHTAAMVKSDKFNEEGRVAVVFKDGGPTKYLKVENLKPAVKENRNYALLVCLPEAEQWKFMMKESLVI